MRCLFALVLGLAFLSLPLRAVAQTTEPVGSHGSPHLVFLLIPEHLEKRLPVVPSRSGDDPLSLEYVEAEPAPPSPAEMKVRRAKIGIGVSAGGLFVGGIVAGAGGAASIDFDLDGSPSGDSPALYVGAAIAGASALALISKGILLGVRKRALRESAATHRRTQRQARWDLARSRLVF